MGRAMLWLVVSAGCARVSMAQPETPVAPKTEQAAQTNEKLLPWQKRFASTELQSSFGYWASTERGLELVEAMGGDLAKRVPAVRERRKSLSSGVEGIKARLKELGENPDALLAEVRSKDVDEMITEAIKVQGGELIESWEKFERNIAARSSVATLLSFNEKLSSDPKAEAAAGLWTAWSGERMDAKGTVTLAMEVPSSWGAQDVPVATNLVVRTVSRAGHGDEAISGFLNLVEHEFTEEETAAIFKAWLDPDTYKRMAGVKVVGQKEMQIAGIRTVALTLEADAVTKEYSARQMIRQIMFLKGRASVSVQLLCSVQAETEAKLPEAKILGERLEAMQSLLEHAVQSVKLTELKAEKPAGEGEKAK